MSPLPPFKDQIVSLLSSLATWAKAGFPVTDRAEFERRYAICKKCEHFDETAFGGTGRCKKCGCSMAKLALKTSQCPINAWDSQPKGESHESSGS